VAIGDPDLRVPKRKVQVELVLRGAAPRVAEMFLAEHQEHTWHRQEVLDLLEGQALFFPVREGGETILVRREAVVWVRIANEEPGDGEMVLFDQKRLVRILLDGGGELQGTIYYAAAPHRSRLVDELNGPGLFLRLCGEDSVYLISKAAVLTVVELEQP
jgi:hypothetical protein